jgi:uncharacterized membrane protein YphA (DoxX/SURF4 family)
MKAADLISTFGRIAFAIAITGFGILCLGYADFVSALQPVPATMPASATLAILTGIVLFAAGSAILADRGTRIAAVVLIVLFVSWILLLHVPSAFLQPVLLRSPWWIRTFETVALAGSALILAARARTPLPAGWIRKGRIAYGIALPVFGVLHLVYPANVAGLVPPWYPFPMFWAYFTGIAQIAAGLAIAAGVLPKPAAVLAGAMYGTWALTLHIPRSWCRAYGPCDFMPEVVGLQGSRAGLTSLFVAIGMCGAAWIVAGGLADEEAGTTRGTLPRLGARSPL